MLPRATMTAVLCLSALAAVAQEAPQTGPTFRTQTTVVTVPVTVKDSRGQRIWALQADDFAIFDNGVPQRVRLDDVPRPPARAIAIVVQENDDTFLLENSLDASLVDFLNGLPEGDIPITVVTAGTKVKTFVPFTLDRDHVQQQLHSLQPDADAGGPKILDGIFWAARSLQEQYPDRQKIVLLVSGAHDGDSQTKVMNVIALDRTDAKAKRQRWNSSHGADEVLQYVEANNIVVDAIEFSRYKLGASDYWKDTDTSTISLNLIGLMFHAADWVRRDIPRHLADATGGEIIYVGRKRSVSTGALRIAADFSAQYDLSFHPTDHAAGLHEIRVTTPGRDKLRVRSRSFYWAQSDLGITTGP